MYLLTLKNFEVKVETNIIFFWLKTNMIKQAYSKLLGVKIVIGYIQKVHMF